MNIHFDDKSLYDSLKASTVATVKVGSHMYGLNNSDSDDDFLNIYIESHENRNSFMWEHHQLQYKEDGIDHNFTSIQNFIRNAMSGDATINFEVLWSEDLRNSKLYWLSSYRYEFINYNIIKSYLGLAKRDLKHYKKETGNFRKHNTETDKKLSHFVRGVIFARMLLNGEFVVDMKDTQTFPEYLDYDIDFLAEIKSGSHTSHLEICDFFEARMNEMRDELNKKLEKGEIRRFMSPLNMESLDKVLKSFCNIADTNSEDYSNLFYDALENGVTY